MDFDLSQFKDQFIEDAQELLNKLENDLLQLEKDYRSKPLVESVFRAMHTLKGVASMYGFTTISEYTHALENVYDAVHKDLMELTDEVFDSTLMSVDHIRNLLHDPDFSVEANQHKQKELLAWVNKLLTDQNVELQALPSIYQLPGDNDDTEFFLMTWYILLRTDESFVKRGIKIVNIFSELSKLGRYRIVEKNMASALSNKPNEEHWVILLSSTATYQDVEDVFMFVLDDCKITKISDTNLFDPDLDFEQLLAAQAGEEKAERSIFEEAEYLFEQSQHKLAVAPGDSNKGEERIENDEVPEKQAEQAFKASSLDRISVDASKLDYLMYLVGELITVNSQLTLSTKSKNYAPIRPYLEQLDKLSKSFRNSALDLRLITLRDMTRRFQRLVRDLSKQLGKEVNFEVMGADTELDKNTIDLISEPLMHIIRNCLDHGIEPPHVRQKMGKSRTGQVNFFAFQQGNNVFINIQDDGAGINLANIRTKAIEKGLIKKEDQLNNQELIDLIFAPGFTTAPQLSEVSGRGVGMDVVRRKIAEIRGEVEVTTELNLGTSFTIKLQQSISIIDTMLVQVEEMFFMLPLLDVEMCQQCTWDQVRASHSRTISYQGRMVPCLDLRETFKLADPEQPRARTIVLNKHDKKFVIVVDRIIGEHQAVLKPLAKTFQAQKLLSSASILANGEMAFMLNTTALQKTISNNQ